MRITPLLSLAALASAIVLPDEHVLAEIPKESRTNRDSLLSKIPSFDEIFRSIKTSYQRSHQQSDHPFDNALSSVKKHGCHKKSKQAAVKEQVTGFDFDSWIQDAVDDPHPPGKPRWKLPRFRLPFRRRPGKGKHGKRPHHGPPHHGPPHHGPPHHGPPHHGPHGRHGHHGHMPNLTIYQLISTSKFTRNLTKYIDDDKDLVSMLNSTKANYTIFAPTDWAFAKLPEHFQKPSKEVVKRILLYHLSPGFLPIGKLIFTHTAPTLLEPEALGGKPQRLLAKFGLRGIKLNYYSKVLAPNIPATNGLIHGVDHILLPPPPTLAIISRLPTVFSTLSLGLGKTGLLDTLASTPREGGTFFAPTNKAFLKLGPRANAFLFSKFGEKFLKALLEYHVVANKTMYSTAYYDAAEQKTEEFFPLNKKHGCHGKSKDKDVQAKTFPHGRLVHLDLPTLLGDKSLAVDIVRHGPFIDIRVNAFVHVAVQDGLARDGVIQVVNTMLIPPKRPGLVGADAGYWEGEELDVEDLKARLAPMMELPAGNGQVPIVEDVQLEL